MSSNTWATNGIFDCFTYQDLDGSCVCIPIFFPLAIFCSGGLEGQIYTIMNQEKPVNFIHVYISKSSLLLLCNFLRITPRCSAASGCLLVDG